MSTQRKETYPKPGQHGTIQIGSCVAITGVVERDPKTGKLSINGVTCGKLLPRITTLKAA